MRYEDRMWVCKHGASSADEDGYPVEPRVEVAEFGKCFLSFNNAASHVQLADGQEYQYSFYIIAPLKKALYPLIPVEGEHVIVKKADETVFCRLKVGGYVTFKKRFLKVWGSQKEYLTEQDVSDLLQTSSAES